MCIIYITFILWCSKMKCNRYTRQFIYKWHARFNPAFNCQVVVKTGKLVQINVDIINIKFILWCNNIKCNRYTRQFIFKLHARFNPPFKCQVKVKTGKLVQIKVDIINITFILWCSKMKNNRYTWQFIFKLHARCYPPFNCQAVVKTGKISTN